jgi:hypothetical protein
LTRLAAALSAYEVTPSFEREERLVAGDLAFERGWDDSRFVRVLVARRRHTGNVSSSFPDEG